MENHWLELFGRFHMVLLHLPIGLLAGVAALEFGTALCRRPNPRSAVVVLAWLTAVLALAAAASGWLLGSGGEWTFADAPGSTYDPDTLHVHRLFGICIASGSLLAATLAGFARRGPFRGVLALTLAATVFGGHLGGSLTHGNDFLFGEPKPAVTADIGSYFAAQIQPILARNCTTCHNDKKHKADLLLTSAEGIQKGGENGPVLVAGKPDASELLRRLELPATDDDHMPPKGKPQPTADEKLRLRDWIAGGAPFTGPLTGATHERVPPAPAAAIATLHQRLVHCAPLAVDSTLLEVDFAAVAPTIDDDAATQLLMPLQPQIARLSLARTKVGDAAMPAVAKMPHLQRLDLRGSAVTSAGVASLQTLPALTELVLAQTAVDDAVVAPVLAMPALQRVYLWNSKVSAPAIEQLRAKTGLTVDTGEPPAGDVVEAEGEVKFSNDAPLPGAPAATDAAALLKPSNTVCPISGKPVDPRYALVHDGKVIGFCCPICLGQFAKEQIK